MTCERRLGWMGVFLLLASATWAQTGRRAETGAEPPQRKEPIPDSVGGESGQALSGKPASQAEFAVPRLVRFSGTVKAAGGGPAENRVVGLTFALYAEQEGGAPLWQEVQNVAVNAQGRYTVLLGSTTAEGLPLEIFAGGEARWLGVQVEGEKEQPRILLVSVPYALKAADAETLGGKPVSEFVLARPEESASASAKGGTPETSGLTGPPPQPKYGAIGTPGNIPKFTTGTDLAGQNMVNSIMVESGGNIGVGTTSPGSILDVSAAQPELRLSSTLSTAVPQLSFYDGANLGGFFQYRNSGSVLNPNMFSLGGFAPGSQFGIVTAGSEKVRVTAAGNVGIGTSTPGSILEIQTVQPELRLTSTLSATVPQLSFYDGANLGGFFQYRNSGVAVNPNMFTLGGFAAGSKFAIVTSGTERVRVDAAGNVGIGTTTPSQKLEVAGNVKLTGGNLVFADNSVQTTAAVSSGGTVTSVAAGTGLSASPSPIVGAGTLSIDTGVVPRLNAANAFSADQRVAANFFLGSATNLGAVHYGTNGLYGDAVNFQPNGTSPGIFLEGTANGSEGGGFFANGNNAVIWSPGDADILRVWDEDCFPTVPAATSCGHFIIGASGTITNNVPFSTNIIVGQVGGANRWRVDGTGRGFFNNGTQLGGADFAEAVDVRGEKDAFEPGDVMVIDETADRHVALAQKPYSTLVAGIYSTKPGVLATPHEMDDPRTAAAIPLAIVGIVPCKVSAENGPIARGDLLVTSSTPGHAMKGADRGRMLGAVVGKAMEPLASGKGVIQVLVTLQ